MTVKEQVLACLEKHRAEAISGQEVAEMIGVSRTAVWKAIKSLQAKGYPIEAVNNRGYTLAESSDKLSEAGICNYLWEKNRKFNVLVYSTIGSTNQELKKRAIDGEPEGTVVVADEQTNGRGRLGRTFYSPQETGIYMSILLRPKMSVTDAVLITTATSVAVCRAIRSLSDIEPTIKWVNDVYVDSHKVCGILTEAVTNFESGHIESLVLGIGLNVKTTMFPDEIKERAGSLEDGNGNMVRNQLAAQVINEVFEVYDKLQSREFISDYRKWSNVIGKKIRFLEKDEWTEAVALDVDQNGGLIVHLPSGQERTLNTGEISVRF